MKLNTVILKVVAPCNLNCTYCYEYNRGDDSWKAKPKMLTKDLAREVGGRVKEYCLSNGLSEFDVNLHGGEPMMLGSVRLQEIFDAIRSNTDGIKINFGMQTNATLANNKILEVLDKNDVAIGVSIDGGEFQNKSRIFHTGEEAHKKIIKGLELIKKRKRLWSGILAVIDLNNDPEETIAQLISQHPVSIDILPPLANFDNPAYVIPPKFQLGEWLIRVFNYWVSNEQYQKIRIKFFEDAIYAIISGKSISDWFGLQPPGYLVIATDGNYEGLDTLKVAGDNGRLTEKNIQIHKMSEIVESEIFQMRMKGAEGLSKKCQECAIVSWCGGGHLPHRYGNDKNYDNPSVYCDDMKYFFSEIAEWVMKQNLVTELQKVQISSKLDQLVH